MRVASRPGTDGRQVKARTSSCPAEPGSEGQGATGGAGALALVRLHDAGLGVLGPAAEGVVGAGPVDPAARVDHRARGRGAALGGLKKAVGGRPRCAPPPPARVARLPSPSPWFRASPAQPDGAIPNVDRMKRLTALDGAASTAPRIDTWATPQGGGEPRMDHIGIEVLAEESQIRILGEAGRAAAARRPIPPQRERERVYLATMSFGDTLGEHGLPGPVPLSQPSPSRAAPNVHEPFMQVALEEARRAAAAGEVPVGAVVVLGGRGGRAGPQPPRRHVGSDGARRGRGAARRRPSRRELPADGRDALRHRRAVRDVRGRVPARADRGARLRRAGRQGRRDRRAAPGSSTSPRGTTGCASPAACSPPRRRS